MQPQQPISEAEREQRILVLKKLVETRLPQMADLCKADAEVVIMSQHAFAADHQTEEYLLLGMAIKYIGLTGKDITIVGDKSV